MEKRWISPREAAEYIGCHVMTVYAWIASGTVPSARLGRKVLVDRRQLDAQLEGQLQAAPAAARGKGWRA
jgi:excisionase family DNA binding protein